MPRDQGLEIREKNFTRATVAQMADLDLRKVVLPAGLPAAIFARPELKPTDDCAQAWASAVSESTQARLRGLLRSFTTSSSTKCRLADFTHPLAWLKATLPASAVPRSRDDQPPASLPSSRPAASTRR